MAAKILFLDLDGTLLNDEKDVTPDNRTALERARAAGCRVAISTGRALPGAMGLVKELGLTGEGCYVSASNGAVLYDCGLDRVLERRCLALEDAEELFAYARGHGLHAQTYDRAGVVAIPPFDVPFVREYCRINHGMPFRAVDSLRELDEPPVKVLLVGQEDRAALEEAKVWMGTHMPGRVVILYNAIRKKSKAGKAGFLAAGAILGLCVAVRMPNVTYMAFILPLWYFGIIKKERFALIAQKTLFCAGGYAAGLFAMLAIISIKYGISAYPDMIASLFGVTETATDYKPVSMVSAMLGDYIMYSAWLALFVLYGILGTAAFKVSDIVFKSNSKNITNLINIFYTAGMAVLIRFCYGRGMFGLDYSSFFCMYKPVTVYLLVTLIACALTLFLRKTGDDLKLWAMFLPVIIFITPLGSNNGLYPIINNLFLVAPVSAYMMVELFATLKTDAPFKKNRRFIVVSIASLIWTCAFFQSVLFGCGFVFHDAQAKKENEAIENLRCSNAAAGLKTTAEKKQAIEALDGFLFESGLNKEQVILYGDIPAVSYIFGMEPAIFTTWADLDSNSADKLSRNLDLLYESGKTPVVIIGKEAIKKRSASGKKDKKHDIIENFIEKSGYKKVYEDALFEVFCCQEDI